MFELKLALTSGATYGVLAFGQAVDGALEGVVLIGAAMGALGVIAHSLRKAARFTRRVSEGVDLLFHLADRMEGLEARVDTVEREVSPDVVLKTYVQQHPARPHAPPA